MPGRPAQELGNFERDVDRPADSCQHLSPRPSAVEAVCLGEADCRVRGRSCGKHDQSAVVQVSRGVKDYPWVVRRRVQMQVLDEACSQRMDILMDEQQKSAGGQQNHRAFEGFKQCYRPYRCRPRTFDHVWRALEKRLHGNQGVYDLALTTRAHSTSRKAASCVFVSLLSDQLVVTRAGPFARRALHSTA